MSGSAYRAQAAPARRSHLRRSTDTIASFLRVDLIEEYSYPLNSAMGVGMALLPVLVYYFQAKFLDVEALYGMTVVGISTAYVLQGSLIAFVSRMQGAQDRGLLEAYLAEPISWQLLPYAMNIWRTFVALVSGMLMLFIGSLLGADYDMSAFPAYLLVLALGMVACMAIGSLAAVLLVLSKNGLPVLMGYGLAASLLGGALFSIDVLPAWLRALSYLVPHAYVISAARVLLLPGDVDGGFSLGTAVAGLSAFVVVVGPVSLYLFHRSLQYSRRMGLLGGY